MLMPSTSLRALLAVAFCASTLACSKSTSEKTPKDKPAKSAKSAKSKAKKAPKKAALAKKSSAKKNVLPKKTKPSTTPEPKKNAPTPTAKAPTAQPKVEPPAAKPATKRSKRRKTYKPSQLVVVTNFEKAQITVNGNPYPEQVNPDDSSGMVLPAGGPYTVAVSYDGKQRIYSLSLRPYETRYLVVELSGYQGAKGIAIKPPSAPTPMRENTEEKKGEKKGRLTVYAKPRGTIIVDGKDTGRKAPNTITPGNGRHEIQIRYEDGEVSETKITRVRETSRIKMFFRQKKGKKSPKPTTSRKPTLKTN